jgi:hypothetical protein
MTNHTRLVEKGAGRCRSPTEGQPTNQQRPVYGDGSEDLATSSVQGPVFRASAPSAVDRPISTVSASVLQSSVSPSTSPRPRRIILASPGSWRYHAPVDGTSNEGKE